jgi:hypothetical protein
MLALQLSYSIVTSFKSQLLTQVATYKAQLMEKAKTKRATFNSKPLAVTAYGKYKLEVG